MQHSNVSYAVPRTHHEIKDRCRATTPGGIEFSITVVKPIDDTTQMSSKELQEARIKAKALAYKNGEGFGNGTNLPLSIRKSAELKIEMRFEYGGKVYRVPVQALGDGSYVGAGQRFANLRKMSQGVMERFEMEQGAMLHASAQAAPAAYGMRR